MSLPPAATRVLPILTPLAAAGLALTMVGATITNLIIGEYALMVQTALMGALAGWVGWVRLRQYEGAGHHVGHPATG